MKTKEKKEVVMTPEALEKRRQFIEHCLKNDMSYGKIATLIGISKQRVYQIAYLGSNRKTSSEVKPCDCKECKKFLSSLSK